MLGPSVDLELGQLLAREPVLREHPLDGRADDLGRAPVELLAQRAALEPARIAGVAVLMPLVEVFSRDLVFFPLFGDSQNPPVPPRASPRLPPSLHPRRPLS